MYRSEGATVLARLPHLRPSVLWVFGAASDVNLPLSSRSEMMAACGKGPNGSGGVEAGRVREVHLEGKGHLFPFEVPGVCAEYAAGWIGGEMQRFRAGQREYEEWTRQPMREKTTMSWGFLEAVGRPPGVGGKKKTKRKKGEKESNDKSKSKL
ncbi:hypothetical protein DL771_002330 [Monosporascus sp. 5C6A]|nr:hypothetical protein DL771_002330 [Monosporascus sp. 5C6A]